MKEKIFSGKILLVDDTLSVVDMVRTALEDVGYEVFVAMNGERAIKNVGLIGPDLILLDIMLPDLNGYKTYEQIKTLDLSIEPTVIFMSARTDTIHKILGFERGAVDYITKPFETQELLARVNVHMKISLLQKELKKINSGLEEKIAVRTSELHAYNLQLKKEIGERKAAEKKILRAKRDWERTFDAVPDMIAIIDKQFKIVMANKAMAEKLGIKPHKITGHFCHEIMHKMSLPLSHCPYVKLLEGCSEQVMEAEVDEHGRNYLISTSPFYSEERQLVGCVHIARDITERVMLEKKLRQAYKMEAIGTLASGIAHDFNNILCAIIGFTELSIDNAEDESLVKNHLNEVLNATSRARELIRQILTFSRQNEQIRKPIKIKKHIEEALKLIRSSLPATIAIQKELQCDEVVSADPTQIHQVVMNLCTNAAYAMRDSGILKVALLKTEKFLNSPEKLNDLAPGRYIHLQVSDTGCGIPSIILDRIYDPFFTTKQNGEGTGMGLSVVGSIIKSHEGNIYVNSEPGKGTTFDIYLPILEVEQNLEKTEAEVIPSGKEHILFIDDDTLLVKMGKQLLQSLGYVVTARASSVEALDLFRLKSDRFDLVITDMTMPELSGYNFIEKLLMIRADVPIIICSGFSNKINDAKVKNMGIKGFINKPFVKKEIAQKIRIALDKPMEK